ncbi:MAG TPA: HlyD family efflux transporter periplasmic adaptor subunit [Usitatibacter sp.]|nr:HlyD family efflux transporter periplasmic adaptor subunit [Usitatibacter sp.]
MKRRNAIALAIVVAAVAALAAWSLRPRPVMVEEATVARGLFEQVVADEGRTRARDRYVISAPLAGRLERVRLKAGDKVEPGQVVAELAPAAPAFLDARTIRELEERAGAAEAQQRRARAELARLTSQRDQARADAERQEKLAREGFVSSTVREQAQLALQTAESALEAGRFALDAAAHDLAQARAALTRFRTGGAGSEPWKITSPVGGEVLRVAQESESVVASGTPLVEVADARRLEAVVEALSQESVTIRPGMPARVELGSGLAPLAARVRLVEPAAFTKVSALGIEEQRVNVVLDFVDPLDRVPTVGDGFRIEAQIVTTRIGDAVKVPVGALFRDGDGWAVYAIQDGRAVKRAVRVPRRNTQEAQVEAGLAPGDRVVVYPPDGLREGARVAPVRP